MNNMDTYTECCQTFGIPQWVAPLLCAASRLKSDRARRKRIYKLIHRRLFHYKFGCRMDERDPPTYVYPEALKQLVRAVFPGGVRDYPDPSHKRLMHVSCAGDCWGGNVPPLTNLPQSLRGERLLPHLPSVVAVTSEDLNIPGLLDK